MKTSIRFQLNGQAVTLDTDDDRMLLWVLRTELGLTGPKYGCGEALCGACTVTVGDKAVMSCKTSSWPAATQVIRGSANAIHAAAWNAAGKGLSYGRRVVGGHATRQWPTFTPCSR